MKICLQVLKLHDGCMGFAILFFQKCLKFSLIKRLKVN